MDQKEKDALLIYLESRLLDLGTILEHDANDGFVSMYYSNIYDILNDLDDTLEAYIELSNNGIKNNS